MNIIAWIKNKLKGIIKAVEEKIEPKDCEHGYHSYTEIYSNGFDFPMREKLLECVICKRQKYKYYDCYMGNIFYEEEGCGLDIEIVHKNAGICEKKIKQDSGIFETQDGRNRMMDNKINRGGYYD